MRRWWRRWRARRAVRRLGDPQTWCAELRGGADDDALEWARLGARSLAAWRQPSDP